MNYRHAFHAGNFADVFKHMLLSRIIIYLAGKDAPMRFIETHAGAGRYDLRSEEATRSGEWRNGVGRLAGANWTAGALALIAPYLTAVGPFDPAEGPLAYPGSPAIAQKLLRACDRLILCEAHPASFKALVAALGRDRRAKAIEIDGWIGLKAYVPPVERRGLALIDPPFEAVDEFDRMRRSLRAAYAKWPTGVYALWHPIKDKRIVDSFYRALDADGIDKAIAFQLTTDQARSDGPLAGCGLLVVNPPYLLEREARVFLPELARVLATGPGASWTISTL